MNVTRFEFVDLGAGPVDCMDAGPSFRGFAFEVMGTGATAHDAMEDALNTIAGDGVDTRLLHESAIEAGYSSEAARVPASELHEDDEKDNPDVAPVGECEYTVLVRYDLEEDKQ